MTLYQHQWTEEQYQFLKDNVTGRKTEEITKLFNSHFGLDLTVGRIKSAITRRKLKSGVNGQFTKGHTPANKGVKGSTGWSSTRFKKGIIPANTKPIGTVREGKDGYIEIKVTQSKWKAKQRVIWEEANGPIPKGYVILFGDGNMRNFDLDNLLLVSRAQLARINQTGLIYEDAELTKVGIIIADVNMQIAQRLKEGQKKRGRKKHKSM